MVRGMRKGWMGHEGTGIFRFGFFCRSLLFIRWETGNKKKNGGWNGCVWCAVQCSLELGTRLNPAENESRSERMISKAH